MKKTEYPYTAISFVFIAMVLFVLFMVSDVLFEERNNLTLLKGAITTEFNGKDYYDNISRYGFMVTKVSDTEEKFLSYMDLLDYQLEDVTGNQYIFISKNDDQVIVKQEPFLLRYYIWDFQ